MAAVAEAGNSRPALSKYKARAGVAQRIAAAGHEGERSLTRARTRARRCMEEKLPPPSPEEQAQRLETERVTRRTFLMNVGIALNAVVALVIATPVVAY